MRALAVAMALTALTGCAAFRPTRLDVPPGQHAILGRVDISALNVRSVIIDIVRDDGTFNYELPVGLGSGDFAITLPPGRYFVARLRLIMDGSTRTFPDDPFRRLRVIFEVGRSEEAIYIGTLRLSGRLGGRVQVTVVDEYARTIAVLRDWYSDLPAAVTRSLMKPV